MAMLDRVLEAARPTAEQNLDMLSVARDVAGYREAFAAADKVDIDSGFVVRVVSLPGLAILKLEVSGYDVDLAGPRLLCWETARIIGAQTRDRLLALLDDGPNLERLSRAMARDMGAVGDPVGAARDLIGQFQAGLREG